MILICMRYSTRMRRLRGRNLSGGERPKRWLEMVGGAGAVQMDMIYIEGKLVLRLSRGDISGRMMVFS